MAVIAFDASSSGTGAAVGVGTKSVAHMVASGGVLFAIVQWNSGASAATGDITGVTYNGVAMTKLVAVASGAYASSIWYLATPTTGSSVNITATSGNANVSTLAVSGQSYTGVLATEPDSFASNTGTNNGGTFTISTTVIKAGCWLISGYASADDAAPTGNTLTRRTLPAQQFASGDSNAIVAAGSQPATWNQTGSGGVVVGTVVSIAPRDITTSVTDSMTLSETLSMVYGYAPTVTDTIVATETLKVKQGFGNATKHDTDWTNLPKS